MAPGDTEPERPDEADTEQPGTEQPDTEQPGTDKTGGEQADTEPVPAGRRHGPWWAWLCLVTGVVLSLTAAATLVGFNVLVDRYTGDIPKDDLLGESGRQSPGRVELDGPLNILLVGSDYRRKSSNQLWRSDTIMLLHVPAEHDRAYLLSFSRDTWVEIPPSEDGKWRGGKDKLNAAFLHGGNGASGYRLLAKTLSRMMDIKFDSGLVIDFYGFKKIVNVLGGVEMCIETPPGTDSFRSIHGKKRLFKKGCQHLTGAEALDYLRQRKQFPKGDWTRMKHQQQFLKALVRRAEEQGLQRDLGKLDRLIRAGGESLTVDASVPLADLAFTVRNIGPEDLVAIQVPAVGRDGPVWYAELVDPAPSLFRAVREDTLDEWVLEHPEHVNSLTD